MSEKYAAISWNRQKKIYDGLLWSGVAVYLLLFIGLGAVRERQRIDSGFSIARRDSTRTPGRTKARSDRRPRRWTPNVTAFWRNCPRGDVAAAVDAGAMNPGEVARTPLA